MGYPMEKQTERSSFWNRSLNLRLLYLKVHMEVMHLLLLKQINAGYSISNCGMNQQYLAVFGSQQTSPYFIDFVYILYVLLIQKYIQVFKSWSLN